MLHFVVAAGLQDIVEADKVGLNIGIGISDGVSYSGLCRQIDHHSKLLLLKELFDGSLVSQIGFDEAPVATKRFNLIESFQLDIDIVVIGHGIQSHHANLFHIMKQPFHQVRPDETRRTSNQYGLAIEIYIILYHCFSFKLRVTSYELQATSIILIFNFKLISSF